MDSQKLAEFVDQHRWLLNNGLVTDSVKNQLFFCGSIVHKEVQALECDVHPDTKTVEYTLYFSKKMLNKVEKHNMLSTATSLFGMWKYKRFLKKEGSLNFQVMLSKFVTDFCGPKWVTKVQLSDFDVYVDNIEVESGTEQSGQQPDKLSD